MPGVLEATFFIRVSPMRATIPASLLRQFGSPKSYSFRRPVGTDQPFREHSHLPTHLSADSPRKTFAKSGKKRVPRTIDHKASDKAAVAFDEEQRRRDDHRRKEEAARERESGNGATGQSPRRKQSWKKVKGSTTGGLQQSRPHARFSIRNRGQRIARWAKEKERLESFLRRAQE